MTLEELKSNLDKVYCKETAHPDWQEKWTKNNPTYGQCVPTALLVQYYFGGEIYKHNVENHYFNIIKGQVVDLTRDQFDHALDYSNSELQQPDLTKAKTKERFEMLKNKVKQNLENK